MGLVIQCQISRLSDNSTYKFNLPHVSIVTDGKHYNRVFPDSVIRCKRSGVTLSFFSSGKLICQCSLTHTGEVVYVISHHVCFVHVCTGTGCRSILHGVYASRLLCDYLSQHLNLPDLCCHSYSTPNAVGALSLGYAIDLDAIRIAYPLDCKNQKADESPFPGMRFERQHLGISLILFGNGHVNSTGLPRTDQEFIQELIKEHDILQQFRI